MSRYIDLDDDEIIYCGNDGEYERYNIPTVAPTADVVERKKGEWIFNPSDAIEMMSTLPKCSECGFESADGGNYCFNCGADMRKGKKKDDRA